MKNLRILLFILLTTFYSHAETFKAGSYIINMGVTPQTYQNGLLPYGMIYDMVINEEVPLYWIIKKGKPLFGTDFTYDGIDYKAGSLVLPAVYVTPAIEDKIANWKTKGVVIVGPTATDFDAPAYNYISSFPNAVLDSKNFALTQALFYNHTEIPNNYWITGTPGDIGPCTDVYALPHADPQDWSAADIATYTAYTNSKSRSFLWQGCHSVGAVEAHSANPTATPPPAITLNITADVTIKVDDKFEIKNFPEINITTAVTIIAKEVKLDNVIINVLSGGSLHISTKDGISFKNGASINGTYTSDTNGGASGNKADGKIGTVKQTLTIDSDKQYEEFKLEDNSAGGGGGDPGYLNLFMLTTNGQIAWKNDIDYTFTNENSPAFEYKSSAGDHPIMQIAGKMDDGTNHAFDGGSQRIYIPRPDSAWRSTTTVAVWDASNINNTLNNNTTNKAALIAYGRTYGDPENGILVQHASHRATHSSNEAHNVNSARIYGNLLLQSSIEKRPLVSIDAPNRLSFGNDYNMTATVERGTAPYDFDWNITCPSGESPGLFTPSIQYDVNESTVVFTPANVTLENCILRVKVTDSCNRKNFATKLLGITGYHPPLGYYNVTHEGVTFPTNAGIPYDPLFTEAPENSLYTQISEKPFNVTLVALNADKTTLEATTGNVILELIDTDGVTDLDPSSCAKASSYANVTDNITESNITGAHFNSSATVLATDISYPNAVKNIGFRISYNELPLASGDFYEFGIPNSMTKPDLDAQFPACASKCPTAITDWSCYECIAKPAILGGYGKSVCARDNFAIRPASFSINLEGTEPFIGGRSYPFEINATTQTGTIDHWYSEVASDSLIFSPIAEANISSIVIIPPGCTTLNTTAPVWDNTKNGTINFVSGLGKRADGTSLSYYYPNVGQVNITAIDNKWTANDQNKAYDNLLYSDCRKGTFNNDTNNEHIDGKVGCMIGGIKDATFIPSRFKNTLSVLNFNTLGDFTYIANAEGTSTNHAARLNLTYTAVLDDNVTAATNYTAGCYANDITADLTLLNNKTLTWSDTENRIWFYDQNTSSSQSDIPASFTHSEALFNHGTANIGLLFNFDRKIQTQDNPFKIDNLDFNIVSVQDNVYPSVTGSDFNRTVTSTVNFLYARAKPTKYLYDDITASTVLTPVMVQVYCDKWPASAVNCPGVDTISGGTNESRWWISTAHSLSNNDGNITLTASGGGTVSPTDPTVLNIINGIDSTVTVTNTGGTPNIVNIDFGSGTNSWMIYNKDGTIVPSPFYRVRFIGSSGWAGHGKTGHVIGGKVNTKKGRRLEW